MMWNLGRRHAERGEELLRRYHQGRVREDLDGAIESYERGIPFFRRENEDRLKRPSTGWSPRCSFAIK